MIIKELNEKMSKQSQTKLFGSRDRRLLSETIRVEEELIPAFVRPILYAIFAILFSFILWSALTELSEVAIAPGEVVPSGNLKVVQHLDGGIVNQIDVKERMLVKPGQILLRMDGSKASADLQQMKARHALLILRAKRLEAFTENRSMNKSSSKSSYPTLVADQQEIFINQIATRESSLDILDRQVNQRERRLQQLKEALATAREKQVLTLEILTMRTDLAKRKLIDRTTLLETRKANLTAEEEISRLTEEVSLVEYELSEAQSRRIDTENQLRQDALTELGTVRAETIEAEVSLQQLQGRVGRLDVRSPVQGYVHELQVQTVGQVIQPGALLMQIVPDDTSLGAEVRINPRDVGYVKVGQHVNLRVSSYDYTRFGLAKGILERISASNIADEEDGQPFFLGWVLFDQPYVGNKAGINPLLSGMVVEAEIVTGEKTLLAYIFKPVVDALSSSFRER